MLAGEQLPEPAFGLRGVRDDELALLGARQEIPDDQEIVGVAVDDQDPDRGAGFVAADRPRPVRLQHRASVRAEVDHGIGLAGQGPIAEGRPGRVFGQAVVR